MKFFYVSVFEIWLYFQNQIRKSKNTVMFSLTSRDEKKRDFVCRRGFGLSEAAFDREHFSTNQKSLRHLIQKLWLK